LTDIVRDKEVRARKYKKCDAYWLLVIVDSVNPAQDQEWPKRCGHLEGKRVISIEEHVEKYVRPDLPVGRVD